MTHHATHPLEGRTAGVELLLRSPDDRRRWRRWSRNACGIQVAHHGEDSREQHHQHGGGEGQPACA
jgi:hypothetical protein